MEVFPRKVFRSKQLLSDETHRAHIITFEPDEDVGDLGYYDYALITDDAFDNIVFILLQYNYGRWSPNVDEYGMYTYVLCEAPEVKWNQKHEGFKHYQFHPTRVEYAILEMRQSDLGSVELEQEDDE